MFNLNLNKKYEPISNGIITANYLLTDKENIYETKINFNIMTPEELKEITTHFLIAKLESDLKIDKIFSEILFSLDTNDKIVSMQLIKVNLKIAEIERQLKELK